MLLKLATDRKVLFLGGKGGVGKTVTASATALHQAQAGRSVLLVSTDPAHNLGHLWEQPVGDEPVEVFRAENGTGSVHGVEIDPQLTIDQYLVEVGQTLRDFMPEHLHPQVTKHLDLAAQTPGTHESAMLERIAMTIEDGLQHYDLIVFDTAPTGHTARLMALPEIMTFWTEGLLNRRTKAEKFGAAIRSLDGDDDPQSASGENRDRRIRQMLYRRKTRFETMRKVLTDATLTSFVIVLIPERVPVLETIELYDNLRETGIDVGGFVINRVSPTDAGEFLADRRQREEHHMAGLRTQLPKVPVDIVPLLMRDLVGTDALRELAEQLS